MIYYANRLIIAGPVLTELNNGIGYVHNAMPMKDLTSDSAASFAMGRNIFLRAQMPTTQKKWIGGNRDASQVTTNNRTIEIGMANALPFSFKTVKDNNTQRQALQRARSGGYTVPAKCVHNYPNAPIFY